MSSNDNSRCRVALQDFQGWESMYQTALRSMDETGADSVAAGVCVPGVEDLAAMIIIYRGGSFHFFEPLEVVHAFQNEAWWKGRIRLAPTVTLNFAISFSPSFNLSITPPFLLFTLHSRMSDKQSSSAPEPRVEIECPDGYVIGTTNKPEVFGAILARESGPYEGIPRYVLSKPEPESPATAEPTIMSLASQLGHVIQKIEILEKEKKDLMEKIRARGGKIRIPKD
ncbi:hypothetical protein FPANT_2446 [Fusarium pseudoanthophilum]|uniref:Uncharacterized protein n=1 Tax=Fusarium pseudoanthophilum TaxID=48495 RepID=A0A8H5PNX2_9HYPO|nr:hypothetical protein FPANT_2446 [Fusarium pseudoanthophilum]